MAPESEDYLAVLKASYDYEPQSEDEIAIKENQILFLKERVDEDWWKVKIKGESQEEDSPVGLVPAAYVEPADHTSVVKAMYDYEASAPGELSVKEDELLFVFDTEEDWLLVQSQKEGGKAGFVPGNYVEATSEAEEAKPTSTPQIIVPPSPPPPVSTYVDPADRVASTKVKADDIKTWSVSEVDKKGKKKKGTLGVGNGAVFFASESDKTPVQKWKTINIENINIEKSKHVHIDVGGSTPINLHFNAGSKDNAEAIAAKLESSKELSATTPSSPSQQGDSAIPQRRVPPMLDMHHKEGKKASVHFSSSSPVIIPPREPSDDGEEEEPEHFPINGSAEDAHDEGEGDAATALYDFDADGDDELSVTAGERLVVLERDGDEWWKCRNDKGAEGVVPASYLEMLSTGSNATPPLKTPEPEEEEDDGTAAQEAEERANAERIEQEQREKERADKERTKLEAQQRTKAAAAAAEAERKKRKDAAAARADPPGAPATHASSRSSDAKKVVENSASSSSGRTSADNNRPPPERTRVWHDRSGQFRVEAAFLGFNNGKLRLHKVNGVIVEVPSEKMSVEDMRYVEKMTSKRSRSSRNVSDDDVPLALQRPGVVSPRSAPPPNKGPKIDWFAFFLSAGCDLDDCTRYASSFERDKIDEFILPDITEATMRSLGLREGDIIRVTKAIEKRKDRGNGTNSQEQLRRDGELAMQLQAEEIGSSSRGPPNLFAGPGGALKNNPTKRRGRPQPSKSLPPTTVDLKAIATVSDHIQRTTSPQLLSPSSARPSSTPVQPPPRSGSALAASSGFEDDAWTNRPSSTRPLAPTPPISVPRVPSAPPSAPAPQPTPTTTAQPAQPSSTGLANTTEADIFNQLSRLSELRKNPATSPPPPSISVPPSIVPTPLASYQVGLGMGSSPSPMGHHLQNQQTGLLPQSSPQPYNGPRGPFAPVPGNQSLLQPLVPTQTNFNNFIPTRPGITASPFQGQPTPSFVAPQPTGFPGLQPIMSQPTGAPFGGYNQGNSFQNNGFGQVQSNPTGFNPGFGHSPFNNGMSSLPPVPPLPPSVSNNTSPANIFAQMKSGTFASENDGTNPQPSDKYDALRPNPLAAQATGWNGYQGGYMGYQR